VIPFDYITEWRAEAPWIDDAQVEQDLVISRALVEQHGQGANRAPAGACCRRGQPRGRAALPAMLFSRRGRTYPKRGRQVNSSTGALPLHLSPSKIRISASAFPSASWTGWWSCFVRRSRFHRCVFRKSPTRPA
jgi:hypothetical protein